MKITLLTGRTFDLEQAFDFPLKITRSAKSRHLMLKINQKKREVMLTIPPLCTLNKAKMFIQEHLDWIEENLAKIPTPKEFEDGETFELFGRKVTIFHQEDSLLAPRLCQDKLIVGGQKCFLHRRVKDFIKQEAKKEFLARSKNLAAQINCVVKSVQIKDTKSRWGSCSTRHNINYNWRIALAPQYVIDYLIAHEVSHLKHLDHSREFWKCVKTLNKGASLGRAWLKTNGNKLYLYK